MNTKNKKENQPKATIQRKQGKNVKEFVPSSKNSVREMNYFKQPTEMNRIFKADFEPIELFPEWPTDEEIKNFDFGIIDNSNENSYLITQENVFYDPKNDDINLPISIMYYTQNEIKWLRPEQYIREYLVDKEVKIRYPNKNSFKIRKRIKETFIEMNQDKLPTHASNGENEDKSLNNSNNKKKPVVELTLDEKRFRSSNKEIFKYYDMPLDIKIVPVAEYLETERDKSNIDINSKNNFGNELNLNLNNINNKAALNSIKTEKNKPNSIKTSTNLINLQQPINNYKTLLPSDLSLEDKLPNFSKWMSSIMQIIKDLEMFQISSLIYPQKDGVPVYNPIGRYWVKLFHMGKFRKIEIDDRMPCGKFDEFLLPRCESIDELWPAILTKAIIKLFSYKSNRIKFQRDKFYNEVGDISVLYSLTGFIPEHLNLNFINEEKFDFVINLLSDTRFLNQQKYFFCYNNYALESTTKKLNYKINYKSNENNSYNLITNTNTNRSLVDQPFLGINIFKNYLKKRNSKNKNFMYSEFSLEGNANYLHTEITQTDGNENNNNIFSDSNKKSPEKYSIRRPSIRINDSNSKKMKSKSKTRASNKLLPVKEINSPSHSHSTGNINVNINHSNKKFQYLHLNLKDEMIINKLIPISFKDSILNLIKEKEENERNVRLALLGKEKIMKFSPNLLVNVNAADTLQIPQKEKVVVAQTKKINSLFQKQELYYRESTDFLIEQKLKSIFSDTAYSIIDLFFSGDEFNMRRLLPVDFTDLKKKILAAQTNFKLLTAQEKKNYISNLKDLKLKHKEEKKQRLLELNEPGDKIYMIKIKNGIKNALNSFIEEFKDEEIAMAKKCHLNNWRFPPPSYFDNTFSKIDQTGSSTKRVDGDNSSDDLKYSNSVKLMNTSWTKDFYVNMIRNINEEPSNLNISHMNNNKSQEEPDFYKNCKEIIQRQKGGIWITWNQFLEIFKGFIIIHNPKHYKSIVNIDNNWYNFKNDINYNEKFAIFLTTNSSNIQHYQNNNNLETQNNVNNNDKITKDAKNPKVDKNVKDNKNAKDVNKDKEKDNSQIHKDSSNPNQTNINVNPISVKYNTDLSFNQNLLPNTKFYNNLNNSCILIIFEPNTTFNYLFSDIQYYIIFDLISTSGKKIFSNIRLTGFFTTYQFDEIYFDQEYYLIITGGVHPFGYNLRILSDHFVETLTYFNYVKRFNGLNQNSITVGYPSIEKNKIYVMARVKIINKENSSILISIKQSEGNVDNYLRQFYEIFLVEKNKERRIFLDKLENLSPSEEPIYLIYTITSPYNILEGSLDLEFLYSNANIKIDLIDLVEPYEVSDKYSFNKHGILMKEQIYIPENTSASFEVELKKRSKNYNPNLLTNQNNKSMNNNDTKTIFENANEEGTLTEFQKMTQSIRMVLELKKEDKQIYQKQFYSRIFISHLEFEHSLTTPSNNNLPQLNNEKEKDKKDKKDTNNANANSQNIPFNLTLKLDLSECPQELKGEYEDPENEYFWFIRIFSTENIAFMKDTSKEEAESQLKEGWEAKQPGRAEKAKLSRKKYLLHVKKQRGELLSAEEENLLNELRNRVYITTINNTENSAKKAAPDNKKSANVNAANNNSANSNTNKKDNNKKDNKEDPLSDEKAFNQAQFLKQSFYARMNKTRTFPKAENHCSLYLKNFLSYVYRDRTIESNNKIRKHYLVESKIEELSKTIDEKVLEYNNKRKRDELDFNEKKRKMVEETTQINKKHFMQRRQFSSKLSEIYTAREKISNDHKMHSEKEKSLQDVLNGDYELDKCVQIYKEICLNSADYQKFKSLCLQVFTYISEKKDEFFKNEIKKFNPKDKSPILKCLEDQKNNNWIIPEDTIKKLNELGK